MDPSYLRARFDATLDDFVDVGLRHAIAAGTYRPASLASSLLMFAIFVVTAGLVLFNGRTDVSTRQWVVFGGVLTGLGVAFVFAYRRFHEWWVRSVYRRAVRHELGGASCLTCEFVVGDDGLVMSSGHQSTTVQWAGVLRADDDGGDLVIALDPGLAVIRRRAFASAEHRQVFVAAVEARRTRAVPPVSQAG